MTCGHGAFEEAKAASEAAFAAIQIDPGESDESEAGVELRDRYATLVEMDHDRMKCAVAALTSYREAAEIVGSLNASSRKGKTSTAAPAPEPTVVTPA